jgi:hypothetical protein
MMRVQSGKHDHLEIERGSVQSFDGAENPFIHNVRNDGAPANMEYPR